MMTCGRWYPVSLLLINSISNIKSKEKRNKPLSRLCFVPSANQSLLGRKTKSAWLGERKLQSGHPVNWLEGSVREKEEVLKSREMIAIQDGPTRPNVSEVVEVEARIDLARNGRTQIARLQKTPRNTKGDRTARESMILVKNPRQFPNPAFVQ